MGEGDPLWIEMLLVLLGGGLVGTTLAVIKYVRERAAESKKLSFDQFKAKIVPMYWKTHPDNDEWNAYAYDHGVMDTVLSYGIVLEFSVSNLTGQDILVTGINVSEPGLASFDEACTRVDHDFATLYALPTGVKCLYNQWC